MITFHLTTKQHLKLENWLALQNKKLLEKQKEIYSKEEWQLLTNNGESAYCGAIDSGVQYIFTPTSLGTAVKVKYTGTGEEINLTDYEEW